MLRSMVAMALSRAKRIHVVDQHVIAGQGKDMCDAGAHLPGPDHAHIPDLHHRIPGMIFDPTIGCGPRQAQARAGKAKF